MSELARRREDTAERTVRLRELLQDSDDLIRDIACVYATGSFGRREAGKDSDLDLFIVSKSKENNDQGDESLLRRLDEICLKADLIKATKTLRIKEFDGDGRYLSHYTINELKQNLGHPTDDAVNTFTARLLLLLESSPLIGSSIYDDVVNDVIAAYSQDYEDHKDDFVPAFLANDILRLWRTFCVNYEVRTSRSTDEKNVKRRKKNYTLKHSRLLTCYSALLYLLCIYELFETVHPKDVKAMVTLSPTERLEWILNEPRFENAQEDVRDILTKYEEFLVLKSDTARFTAMFSSSDATRTSMRLSHDFAALFFTVIQKIGNQNRLHKLLVV